MQTKREEDGQKAKDTERQEKKVKRVKLIKTEMHEATQRFLLPVVRYTNMFQMIQTWKMNESHNQKALFDGQQTGCTHLNICNWPILQTLSKSTNTVALHSHTVFEHHRKPKSYAYMHMHTHTFFANTIHR